MRIGVDLDGVVVDFVGACANILLRYKAEDVRTWDDVFTLAGMTATDFFEACRIHGIFEQALPVMGALSALDILDKAGHEVYFITARPEWAVDNTVKWLEDFGLPVGHLHVLSNNESKSEVSCDLYLDDSPHVLADLMDNHRRVVRYERPWNLHSSDWDFSVANWEQFVTLVEEIKNRKVVPKEKWFMSGPQREPTMASPNLGGGWEFTDEALAERDAVAEPISNDDYFDGGRFHKGPLSKLSSFYETPFVGLKEGAGETRVVDPVTGGAKGTKLARFDLIPADALKALAEHFGEGAKKYEDRNWERGYNHSLTFAAMMRHAWAHWGGEDVDPETGSLHMVAAMWHATVLTAFLLRGAGTDDRPSNG